MLHSLTSLISFDSEDKELNRARFEALGRQLPLMYGIIAINMVAAVSTHYHDIPFTLSTLVPGLLLLIGIARTAVVIRDRKRVVPDDEIAKKLHSSVIRILPLAATYSIWAIFLFSHGDARQNSQMVFFTSVTTMSAAFCMMHAKQAAIMILWTVTALFSTFLMTTGNMVNQMIGLNMVLIALVFGALLSRAEQNFCQLVMQKRAEREQLVRLQMLNEENHRLANTDSLTGLANRRQFLAEIDSCVERYENSGEEFVVALMDLDGFKPVNDVFGHPAGDQVLIETGRRLRACFDSMPVTIARLGGDEFGLLFHAPGNDDDIMAQAHRACETFDAAYSFDEGSANISATIGMARFPAAANSRALLFDRADYALYYAKQNAKSEPVFFSHEHERLIFASSALEQALRHADLDREMRVEFQPVLDLASGHTRGLEALARWYCPTLGRIRPDLFIKAAENIGMMGRLSEVLFRKAVDEARMWPDHLTLSFNLSATSLSSVSPVMRLLSIAQRAGFPASRIVFEITESAVMNDFDSAMDVLSVIREAGAHVAIDDFGTGFSSLAYVHRLPIDILKIDRSFVHDLSASTRSANVMRSILSLCENLDIACIVEGVETQEQFDLVCDLGGSLIQGYYYSKPLSAGDTHMVLQIEFSTTAPPPEAIAAQ